MSIDKLITDHIDIWSSALQTRSTAGRGNNGKINLYGIKKLRELILDLAVRGKLVPQDPNDEPASELLKRIAAEKAELVKLGKIKKQKPLPAISEDEKPFALPKGWEWCRLPDICSYRVGKTPPSKDNSYWDVEGKGIPWVSIADLNHEDYVSSTAKMISEKAKNTSFSYPPIKAGTILMSFKLTVGKVSIIEMDAFHNEAIISINHYSGIEKKYLFRILPLISSLGRTKQAIMGSTLNSESLSRLLLPIPPQQEQIKIISRYEQFLSICDQLEQQSLTSLDAHQQLVETLLATLTDSQDSEALAENWDRISQYFDTLFTTEASIDSLKQTILQLAVMGKLVPQDPNDEPASELLKRIEQEKTQLVKEGKIKKQKTLPPVSDKEKPFELPRGWEWCRFEDIVDIQSGITKGRNILGRELVSVPYLRVANVQRGYIDLSEIKTIEIPADEKEKYHVKLNDLLITEGGDWDTVGRTAIWTKSSFYVANQNHVFKARPIINELNVKWLETFMNSSISRNYFASASKQTTNLASINKTQLRGCFVALPPNSEINRILAQYQAILSIFDDLKSHLQLTQQTQLNLADALTDTALN